jgi:tyrosine aminotransferase
MTVDPSNVIVANGCSGALELALTAMLDDDSILLVPQPGFPLYQVIAESHGASVVHYRLDPDQHWQCDLEHLQTLLQRYKGRIRALLLNNPSNPTGAVFSKRHLQDVLRFCQHHHLAVVADEIYGDLTFGGHTFHPTSQIAHELGGHVPVITASGLGKQFLLPGWRVGWIVFHDKYVCVCFSIKSVECRLLSSCRVVVSRLFVFYLYCSVYGSLQEVQVGAKRLAQVILGASHLTQTAIPAALATPLSSSWKIDLIHSLEQQAAFLCERLSRSPGLQVVSPPGGAMYAMVRIDVDQFSASIGNELEFTQQLLLEENVFVLPGSCFGIRNVFRVVFCAPISVLEEASTRMNEFCQRHVQRKEKGDWYEVFSKEERKKVKAIQRVKGKERA